MKHLKSVTHGSVFGNAIKAVLAAFALAGMAGTSEAISYVDVDRPNTRVDVLDGYHGIFNIINPGPQAMDFQGIQKTPAGGYQVGTELLSATASFYLYNRRANLWETASVYIGLLDGEFSQVITTGYPVLDLNASSFSLLILQSTGVINYAVHSSVFGDFRLEYAVLEVTTKDTPAPGPVPSVPDGGATLLLLGVGFIGLMVVQSRLTRQTA